MSGTEMSGTGKRMAAAEAKATQMRGYIITEDNDMALKDLAEALDAIAMLCEERTDQVPEMTNEMWGGLFRTFGRQAKAIHSEAAFANHATARPRADLN